MGVRRIVQFRKELNVIRNVVALGAARDLLLINVLTLPHGGG